MDIGQAIRATKEGKQVSRRQWRNPVMRVFFVPSSTFNTNRPPLLGIYPPNTTINYNAHLDIILSEGNVMTWTPTQGDLVADDWYVVD